MSEKTETAINDEITKLLKKEKSKHYNLGKPIEKVLVSTGSLILDDKIGGGICPGISSAFGATETGKTNFFLSCMRNFLNQTDGLGVYVKSEGRLEEEIPKRHGLSFVDNPGEWNEENPFLLKCQDFSLIIDFINKSVETCGNKRLCFILDSLDAVIDEGAAMMSMPKSTKDLLRRISLKFNELGHYFWIIGQRSSKPQDKYTANEDRDHIGMAGGHAVQHFSNWLFQFAPHDQKTNWIVNAEKERIGHMCLVRLKKSTNNATESRVSYPILYDRKGSPVWLEHELMHYMQMYKWLDRETPRASWKFNTYLIESTKKNLKMELPESLRSDDRVMEFLNESPEFVDFWVKKVKERIKAKSDAF